jgi:hypothetical protein
MADDGMLRFELDEITVRDIEFRLGVLRAKAPTALKNAINATAKDARTDLWAKANATYTIKKGGFNKDMKLTPANVGSLEAVLLTRGAPIEMIKFRVTDRKGTPRVEILRGQVKSMGDRSFVNNVAKKGTHTHVAVAKYIGGKDSRLKIQKKFSVSSPIMIGNERKVYGIVEPNIIKNLQNNVDKQVNKILGGI